MKSILMSIKPQYVAKILNKEKTIEVRKRFPKDYRGWVYIYCTKSRALYDLRKEKGYDFKFGLGERDTYNTIWSSTPILNGKVVARFYCDNVEEIEFVNMQQQTIGFSCEVSDEDSYYCTNEMREKILLTKSCLSFDDIDYYLKRKNGYAVHISQLEIFDKPKELWEFKQEWYDCGNNFHSKSLTKAPQSMMYIEVDE